MKCNFINYKIAVQENNKVNGQVNIMGSIKGLFEVYDYEIKVSVLVCLCFIFQLCQVVYVYGVVVIVMRDNILKGCNELDFIIYVLKDYFF